VISPIVGRCFAIAVLMWLAPAVNAQHSVTFTTSDGARISADLYPPQSKATGARGVILAHGGRFTKESWKPQAEKLSAAGFRVLALDFRGFGESAPRLSDPLSAPLYLDLLAAAAYLRAQGATSVSIVGGSLGGMAAGDAVRNGKVGEIERVVFLGARASLAGGDISAMGARKLFIVARNDPDASGKPRLERIQADFDRVPEPRRMFLVDGTAHAQALFDTDQGEQVFQAILEFLRSE
jgi:dienelactone hydrolase